MESANNMSKTFFGKQPNKGSGTNDTDGNILNDHGEDCKQMGRIHRNSL